MYPKHNPITIATKLRTHHLLLINPTVASASIVNAHSSGTPNTIISCAYQGNSAKVSVPHNNPLIVLVVTAAVIAYVALPLSARGKPSTIVAAALLAPGIPNSTPVNVSPVVLAATTAIQKITPKYGSPLKYPIKLKSATKPVVAPALGMMPITSP